MIYTYRQRRMDGYVISRSVVMDEFEMHDRFDVDVESGDYRRLTLYEHVHGNLRCVADYSAFPEEPDVSPENSST
jgi:hypothetical protein